MTHQVPAEARRKQEARRGLTLFFALLVPLSAIAEGFIILTDNIVVGSIVLMWMPGLSSIIARLVYREGFADVSFRLGGRRGMKALIIGLLFPLAIGLIAYVPAWYLGLTTFAIPVDIGGTPPAIWFAGYMVVLLTYGTILSALKAAGEEIGWRGYMLTRLVDAKFPRPVLLSGLIWGAWHLPLIFSGLYLAGPSRGLAAGLFMVMVAGLGYVLGRLRLETGSVLPAVILHASWGEVIQTGFDVVTTGSMAWLWTGEAGLFVVFAVIAAAAIFARGRWRMIRALPSRGKQPIKEEIERP
jgi:uncharacterized protein